MAPSRSQPFKSASGRRFEVLARKRFSSTTAVNNNTTASQVNVHAITLSSSASDLYSGYLLPTALEPQPIRRPQSSGSALPTVPYRKNMKDFTGFDTSEAEFEALPLAVRRKVCVVRFLRRIGPDMERERERERCGRITQRRTRKHTQKE